jgi:hypothetical protein
MMEWDRLKTTSLLSILLMTFHLADDTVRAPAGTREAGSANIPALLILAVWLYGALVLGGRRSGHVVMLLGSLLGVSVALVHMMRSTGMVGGWPATAGEAWWFVWTTITLGVTASFGVLLALRELWRGRTRVPRPVEP